MPQKTSSKKNKRSQKGVVKKSRKSRSQKKQKKKSQKRTSGNARVKTPRTRKASTKRLRTRAVGHFSTLPKKRSSKMKYLAAGVGSAAILTAAGLYHKGSKKKKEARHTAAPWPNVTKEQEEALQEIKTALEEPIDAEYLQAQITIATTYDISPKQILALTNAAKINPKHVQDFIAGKRDNIPIP